MRLLQWLLGRDPLGSLEHWTPERAKHYERETLARLGRIAEPHYDWHAKWLKAERRKRGNQSTLAFKRSA